MFNGCYIGIKDVHGKEIKEGDFMKLPQNVSKDSIIYRVAYNAPSFGLYDIHDNPKLDMPVHNAKEYFKEREIIDENHLLEKCEVTLTFDKKYTEIEIKRAKEYKNAK